MVRCQTTSGALNNDEDDDAVNDIEFTFNPLRPNNDLSQTSHCNINGVSVSEVMRIENEITPVRLY